MEFQSEKHAPTNSQQIQKPKIEKPHNQKMGRNQEKKRKSGNFFKLIRKSKMLKALLKKALEIEHDIENQIRLA